jgi:hypothetical protein
MNWRPEARFRRRFIPLGFLFLMSVWSLMRVLDRPGLAAVRTIDLVQLTGAAAGIGASLFGLVGFARFRHFMRVSQQAESRELVSELEPKPR